MCLGHILDPFQKSVWTAFSSNRSTFDASDLTMKSSPTQVVVFEYQPILHYVYT